MLKENLRQIRKAKGLSQEALAADLHVVRQTVSKWEQGLSLPDAEMLIHLSERLETPVSILLGETVSPDEPDTLKAISERLEAINLQLALQKRARRKVIHRLLILLCVLIAVTFGLLIHAGSPYLEWDTRDPETAVVRVAFHAFEWFFVRIAPPLFLCAAFGVYRTREKR